MSGASEGSVALGCSRLGSDRMVLSGCTVHAVSYFVRELLSRTKVDETGDEEFLPLSSNMELYFELKDALAAHLNQRIKEDSQANIVFDFEELVAIHDGVTVARFVTVPPELVRIAQGVTRADFEWYAPFAIELAISGRFVNVRFTDVKNYRYNASLYHAILSGPSSS